MSPHPADGRVTSVFKQRRREISNLSQVGSSMGRIQLSGPQLPEDVHPGSSLARSHSSRVVRAHSQPHYLTLSSRNEKTAVSQTAFSLGFALDVLGSRGLMFGSREDGGKHGTTRRPMGQNPRRPGHDCRPTLGNVRGALDRPILPESALGQKTLLLPKFLNPPRQARHPFHEQPHLNGSPKKHHPQSSTS